MATRALRKNGRTFAKSLQLFRLRVRAEKGREVTHDLAHAVVRVGSGEGNEVVLDDPAVSRIHFEISADDHGFCLRDLGSTNGTFVDGQRVLGVYLREGAKILVGRTELTFEPVDQRAEIPLHEEDSFGPLFGKSPRMRELFATLDRIARTSSTVLVEGESGTGKELICEAIHRASARADCPFIVFDCAATPASLMESELFGHERGAFTSAATSRPGRLESADTGTFFLDEIGELPLDLQPKLLRALEQRKVRRVGGDDTRAVDIRVLAATNRDLAEEVNRGAFRHDLYYRLAVVRVEVPPLRERAEDIPLLVEHFLALARGKEEAERCMNAITSESWYALAQHPWPGNIRELKNAVDRTLALAGDSVPTAIDLNLSRRARSATVTGPTTPRAESPPSAAASAAPSGAASADRPAPTELPVDLDRGFVEQKAELVARFEEAYIEGLLARHDGKIARAALAAGVDRMYFKRLMRKYQKAAVDD